MGQVIGVATPLGIGVAATPYKSEKLANGVGSRTHTALDIAIGVARPPMIVLGVEAPEGATGAGSAEGSAAGADAVEASTGAEAAEGSAAVSSLSSTFFFFNLCRFNWSYFLCFNNYYYYLEHTFTTATIAPFLWHFILSPHS